MTRIKNFDNQIVCLDCLIFFDIKVSCLLINPKILSSTFSLLYLGGGLSPPKHKIVEQLSEKKDRITELGTMLAYIHYFTLYIKHTNNLTKNRNRKGIV